MFSSRPYTLLNDQLQHWNAEAERYKLLTDALQVKLFCACALDDFPVNGLFEKV